MLKNSVLVILTTSFLLLISTSSQAIVNMDGLLFGAEQRQGLSANVEVLFSGTSGNSDTTTSALNAQVNWVQAHDINLLLLGYKYGKANGVQNADNAFGRLRHIHNINKSLDWEVFAQLEQNQFTRLSYRGLLGGDLRFGVGNTSTHKGFLGIGSFYSKEKIQYRTGLTDDGTYEKTRGNFYFLSRYKATPTIKWSNAVYYQPRVNQLSDYRALLQSKLDFKINHSLSFRVSLDIAHDSEPSQTIKKTDTSYSTGLKWSF